MLRCLPVLFAAACGGEDKAGDLPGVPPGQIQVVPSAIDFGALELWSETVADLELSNTGTGDLALHDVQFDDDRQRAHWTLDGGLSGTLSPGESVTIVVVAHPTSLDDPSVHLLVLSDDPGDGRVSVALSASVYGIPDIGVDPPITLDLGNAAVGESATGMVHIGNGGTDDLEVEAVTLAGDSAFTLDVDPTGTVVRAGDQDGLAIVRFTPTESGEATGTLSFATNDPDEPTATVALVGTGVR